MAFRYLIYATGTAFATTILRESATDNPAVNEASFYTDFIIPEIQPLYLWRVTGGNTVEPNLDSIIYAYELSISPPIEPTDLVTYGELTGITASKINVVTGATGKIGVFVADGNLENSGYAISDLTGTTYAFVGSGGTQVFENGSTITIYSAVPTGTTVAWGDITGTLSAQTDLQLTLNAKLDITNFNNYTGDTATALGNKLDSSLFNSYTGTTQPIIDVALTGVTNLGTGTTIGQVSGRNGTFKSISVVGGISISGDADNIILSGETNVASTWGNISGTLSSQTDLWGVLTGKTNNTTFNIFTGTTLPANYYNKTEINDYTGATDTRINALEAIGGVAITGATNGLTTTGQIVELGGTLTKDTTITGLGFGLSANTKNIHLQAINGINIIDTDGVGGINIESDSGTISLIGNTNLGSEQTKLEISETSMLITDSRTTKVGLQYAGDYSTSFTNESLITKRYADAIASGLIPKAAVLVTTTVDVVLSGLQTIDGITLQAGDRVLVKNNTDASENGIYVAAAGGWSRSTDYDGNPDGEVSSGNIIPIISGNTQYNTIWVLVTPNPITVGTSDLDFTLFSKAQDLIAGTGVSILGNTISVDGASLVGNSLSWTGNTFNVDVNSGTLATALGSKLNSSDFNTFTGTTLPANYYNKTEINTYTGTTATAIGDKLDTNIFNTYTGSTANANKKIQLISTGTTDVNTVIATAIDWDIASPYASDIYNWSGGSSIYILSGGTFEVQYHLVLKNDDANQTHSVGAYAIKTTGGAANTLPITATAGVIVGRNAGGELTLPMAVLTLATNDTIDLVGFRIGNSGVVDTVPNSVYLSLNKLT